MAYRHGRQYILWTYRNILRMLLTPRTLYIVFIVNIRKEKLIGILLINS